MVGSGLTESANMGLDASGIVKRIGAAVSSVGPGDRVATLCNGAFRNVLRTSDSLVVRLPDDMSSEEGASIPVAYTIAYHALCEAGRLTKGETVLIHCATGGMVLRATQRRSLSCASYYEFLD